MKYLYKMIISISLILSACTPIKETPQETPEIIEFVPTNTATPSPSPQPPTETAAPPTETSISPTAILQAYGPDNFPENINPLTGLEVDDLSLLDRRPVAVKVQIFPRGQRPPWGVSLANIVFDYYQNSGLTRFHAIFYGTDAEQVAPIRSARLFDGTLMSIFESIFAFGGADHRIFGRLVNSQIGDRLIVEGNSNCPPMCRVDPNGYNILMTNTAELSSYADAKGISNEHQNLNGFIFDPIPPENGETGLQVNIRYSISSYLLWDYNPSSGRYIRFQDNQEAHTVENEALGPLYDQLAGEQIATENIVVLFLPHTYAFSTGPGKNEIIDIHFTGSGLAYAYREGLVFTLQWERQPGDTLPKLTSPDGSLYRFKPGNTWFQVIGQSSTEEILENGARRFQFSIP